MADKSAGRVEGVFRIGELFCGPGGLAAGAELANRAAEREGVGPRLAHAWANDIDFDACRTYATNFPEVAENIFCQDVRDLDLDAVPDYDALTFGFPCNDFSAVGLRKGFGGDYGPLFRSGVKALEQHQPRWFLAENVSGLRGTQGGAELRLILEEMRDAGYVVTPHLYKLEEYEVPQARHRILIVGIHEDENVEFRVPKPPLKGGPYLSCSTELARAMPDDVENNEPTRMSPTVVKRLDLTLPGENVFQMQRRLGDDLPADIKLNVAGATLSQIYKRLHPDRPSYTITGSGGGGTHVYHWSESRALTSRERARLQTFPDTHVFEGGRESVRRQVGMAVPPRGVSHVFLAVLKTFSGISYPSEQANIEMPARSLDVKVLQS